MSRAKWAGAVRVSTDEQEVAQQEHAIRAAAERQGADVVVWVRIEGVSAWDPKTARDVERQMLAPIEAGTADTLAVWGLDRVTRQGIKEALRFLDRLEKHLGGKLFSVTEPFLSTATMNPETRELLVSLMAWLASRESTRKSERVLAKREAKVNRAAALGQQATWGRGSLATPGQLEAVWRLRDQGLSVRLIAKGVNVSKSQVSRILARPRPATATGVPMDPPGQTVGVSEPAAPLEGAPLGQSEQAPSVPTVPGGAA